MGSLLCDPELFTYFDSCQYRIVGVLEHAEEFCVRGVTFSFGAHEMLVLVNHCFETKDFCCLDCYETTEKERSTRRSSVWNGARVLETRGRAFDEGNSNETFRIHQRKRFAEPPAN